MFDSQRELLKGLSKNKLIDKEELKVIWAIGHQIAEHEKAVPFETWIGHLVRNKMIRKMPDSETYELLETGLKIIDKIRAEKDS